MLVLTWKPHPREKCTDIPAPFPFQCHNLSQIGERLTMQTNVWGVWEAGTLPQDWGAWRSTCKDETLPDQHTGRRQDSFSNFMKKPGVLQSWGCESRSTTERLNWTYMKMNILNSYHALLKKARTAPKDYLSLFLSTHDVLHGKRFTNAFGNKLVKMTGLSMWSLTVISVFLWQRKWQGIGL